MFIVDEAASLIATARLNQVRIAPLPITRRPRNIAEAHAIQDAVAMKLGAGIGGFKAVPPAAPEQTSSREETQRPAEADASWRLTEGIRAIILDNTVHASPCVISSSEMPQRGVEGEIAFRFRCDLPSRDAPYTREEIVGIVDAFPAIEVVSSRFAGLEKIIFLDDLADCMSNAGFVYGDPITHWQQLHLGQLKVVLLVNGQTVVDQIGGHPTGDPFGVVVALVEMMRTTVGVRAGQFVTCGSFTGLRYLNPGDVCEIRFEGLGAAQLTFSP